MAKERVELRKWAGIFICSDIWLNSGLDITSKAILVEVDSLTFYGKDGICTKSNKDFTEILGCSEKTVSRTINKLVDEGLLLCDVVKSVGNERSLLVDYENLSTRLGIVFLPGGLCSFGGSSGQNVLGVASNCPEGYGQNVHRSINRNRSNREDTGRDNASPAPDYSNVPETRAGQMFSTARSQLELLLPDKFFEWFLTEVLGRFDKYAISKVQLKDWHDKLWSKYGNEISTEAISEHRADKEKGWTPNFASVIKIARQLKIKQNRRIRGEQGNKKPHYFDPDKKTLSDMTLEELEGQLEKYEKLNNAFMVEYLKKQIAGMHKPERMVNAER